MNTERAMTIHEGGAKGGHQKNKQNKIRKYNM